MKNLGWLDSPYREERAEAIAKELSTLSRRIRKAIKDAKK